MKVSTLIMTYNHEPFIAQAIQSALAQETSFPHEIIISEDCSTDGTREIVQSFAQRHPEKIRLILSEQNVRSNEVVARGIRSAKGQYVALLDGDDYWTDHEKLEKQATFLDAHADYSTCFHNARVEDANNQASGTWTRDGHPAVSSLEDILRGNFIATCSTMFRRGLFDVPEWYNGFFPITDWPLHILNAEHGNIGYIDEVMGVYRHHAGGLFSVHSQDRKLDETAAFYRKLNKLLDRRLETEIHNGLFYFFVEWAEVFTAHGDFERATKCLSRAAEANPYRRFDFARRYVGNWLRLRKILPPKPLVTASQ